MYTNSLNISSLHQIECLCNFSCLLQSVGPWVAYLIFFMTPPFSSNMASSSKYIINDLVQNDNESSIITQPLHLLICYATYNSSSHSQTLYYDSKLPLLNKLHKGRANLLLPMLPRSIQWLTITHLCLAKNQYVSRCYDQLSGYIIMLNQI